MPEKLTEAPWVRWPPWGRAMPRIVSPGWSTLKYTAMLADEPEWGCTFTCSAPKIFFARSIASDSTASAIFASAVVAPVRVSLGVLVREDRTLGLEHGLAHIVLGGNQHDLFQFALLLALDGVVNVDVRCFQF